MVRKSLSFGGQSASTSIINLQKGSELVQLKEDGQCSLSCINNVMCNIQGGFLQATEQQTQQIVVQGNNSLAIGAVLYDKRGYYGSSHVAQNLWKAVKQCRRPDDIDSLKSILSKLDDNYRKNQSNNVGLFVGTAMSAVLVSRHGFAVTITCQTDDIMRIADDSLLSKESQNDLDQVAQTKLILEDSVLTITKYQVHRFQGQLVLCSPGVWQHISRQRVASKFLQYSKAFQQYDSDLSKVIISYALQQVLEQLSKRSDRRYRSIDDLEQLYKLPQGKLASTVNIRQRLRGNVHQDMAVVVINFTAGLQTQPVTCSTPTSPSVGVRNWMKYSQLSKVYSTQSLQSLLEDSSDCSPKLASPNVASLHRSRSTISLNRTNQLWSQLRVHVWAEIQYRRYIIQRWVNVLYQTIVSKDGSVASSIGSRNHYTLAQQYLKIMLASWSDKYSQTPSLQI